MQPSERIGNGSMAAAVAVITMAQAFHPFILLAVQQAYTAAWLAFLGSVALAILGLCPVALALSGRRSNNLMSLARAALGEPGAVFVAVVMLAVLVLHTGFVIREVAEMAVTAVYPHTPQSFATVGFTLTSLYGSYVGTAGLARLCRAFVGPLVVAIVLALTGALSWGQSAYLLPFWGPGGMGLALGATQLMSGYMGLLWLLTTADRLDDRSRLLRCGVTAIVAGGLPVAAVLAAMVMVFPLPMAYHITFPLHEMVRLVMGGRFLERLEGLWLLFWVFASAGHVAVLWHTVAVAYRAACGLPNHQLLLPALAALATTAGLFPPDQGRVIAWHLASAPLLVGATFGLPLLLTAIAALRTAGKGASHGT